MKHAVAVALAVVAQLGTASAESRSWSVARSMLPSDVEAVAGVNLAGIQDTAIYQQLMPGFLALMPEVRDALDQARTTCGVDVARAIRDVSVAATADDRGIVVLALDGVGPDEFHACAQKLADRRKPGATVTRTVSRGITAYGNAGDTGVLYAAWLARDVVALATDPADRGMLQQMIGGGGAAGDLAAAARAVDTGAELWLAIADRRQVGEGKVRGHMRMAYAGMSFTRGSITIDGSMVMASREEARALAAELNQQVKATLAELPPEMARIARNTRFSARGDATRVLITMTEHDLMSLIGAIMRQLHTPEKT